jgi:Sulfatase
LACVEGNLPLPYGRMDWHFPFEPAIAVLSWNMGNKIITPVNGVLFMNVVPVAAFAVSALSGIVPTRPSVNHDDAPPDRTPPPPFQLLGLVSMYAINVETPNIDRIAREGMMFTDSYGEQSCTAGRSSFITGQSVYRTGLSKVGIPGAPIGMSEKLATIAACLKNQGYASKVTLPVGSHIEANWEG